MEVVENYERWFMMARRTGHRRLIVSTEGCDVGSVVTIIMTARECGFELDPPDDKQDYDLKFTRHI